MATASADVTSRLVQLPEYAEPIFEPFRYKVLWGGRGAGRSWTVAQSLLILAAQSPIRVLCTRELQTSLQDSVMQLLADQIRLLGLTGYTILRTEIRHENGSLFLFEGLRYNVTKIKSLEGIDICWVEEAERISAKSWSILVPTIRKPGSEIWVTFNTDQEDDATYQRFVVHPPPNSWIQKVSWQDNPWFYDTELPAEKDYDYRVDAESADNVWGGNVRKVSDAQILRGKWSVEEFQVPYVLQRDGSRVWQWSGPYQGVDFGFSTDPFGAIRAWVHERTLYVEYEAFRLGLEIDHITQFVQLSIPGFSDYATRGDSSRPDSISYLKRHGLARIEPAKKGPGSVEDGIAHLRAYERIVVNPRCPHFITECKRYKYKVDKLSGLVLPVIVDADNHLMDALRYALEPVIVPQAKVGFIFPYAEGQGRLCPRCDAWTPSEATECEHCGFYIGNDVQEPGNSNGNGNGNGHVPAGSIPAALRGING